MCVVWFLVGLLLTQYIMCMSVILVSHGQFTESHCLQRESFPYSGTIAAWSCL